MHILSIASVVGLPHDWAVVCKARIVDVVLHD
jgi:hypothetical protein